jgi:hypothetical protein
MTKHATVAVLLLGAGLVRADEPTPISVAVGGTVNVCKAGLIVCPVSSSICDDAKVAVIENGTEGAVVKGVSPGTTLCSVRGHGGAFRRLIRVTVTQ